MTPDELIELRKRAGLTQAALAQRMGLAKTSGPFIISAWENGRRKPKGPTLVALRLTLEKVIKEREEQ
jgi:DNA-binding transcriptional regulator YiaG